MDAYSGGAGLPEVDAEEVARFVAIANCPADQAHFFLQATDGNFDRALTLYFGACPQGCQIWQGCCCTRVPGQLSLVLEAWWYAVKRVTAYGSPSDAKSVVL